MTPPPQFINLPVDYAEIKYQILYCIIPVINSEKAEQK